MSAGRKAESVGERRMIWDLMLGIESWQEASEQFTSGP